MRVLSLNFGDETCASSQFRIHAYQSRLQALGIELDAAAADGFEDWSGLGKRDVVIVQKKLLPSGLVRRVRRQARRLVYDIDDAIWEPHGRRHHWPTRLRTWLRLRAIVRASDLCLAANSVIAGHLRPWSRRVEVFPMALDETVWKPAPRGTGAGVVLGWSGAPGNLAYLESLEPALAEVQRRHPSAVVRVLCGRAPAFRGEVRAEHVPWRPGAEAETVQTFDVGLLPLADNPFAAAKSPIKGLQYLACGVPVVATPLAATRELFEGGDASRFARSTAEWVEALDALLKDASDRERLSRQAAEFFVERYSLSRQAARLAALLRAA